jgi:hypothetical protein
MFAQELECQMLANQQVTPAQCGRMAAGIAELDDHGIVTVLGFQDRRELGLLAAGRRAGRFAAQRIERVLWVGALASIGVQHGNGRLTFGQRSVERTIAQDQIAWAIMAVVEQCDQSIVCGPQSRVVVRADEGGHRARKGAAEEALRALIVKKPGDVRIEAVAKVALRQGGPRTFGLEQHGRTRQCGQSAQGVGAALGIDAIQRPSMAVSTEVAHQCVAGGARTPDPPKPRTERGQCTRYRGLTDPQLARQVRGLEWTACIQARLDANQEVVHAADHE